MGDDSTPGCIYKFVPDRAFNPSNRAANTDLLDYGTLYVARFNGDGTGEWRALVVGQNGLTAGAQDPGNVSQSTRSEEHTSELQSLMRISYAVFCLKKKKTTKKHNTQITTQQQKH